MKTLLILLLSILLISCEKQKEELIEINFVAVWFNNCRPPDTNTALVSIDENEYVFNLKRTGNSYRNENKVLISPGKYKVSLLDVSGMRAFENVGDMDGAVIIPSSYDFKAIEGNELLFQLFCD